MINFNHNGSSLCVADLVSISQILIKCKKICKERLLNVNVYVSISVRIQLYFVGGHFFIHSFYSFFSCSLFMNCLLYLGHFAWPTESFFIV